jgi:thioredoxin-like negative regulator of GroEL
MDRVAKQGVPVNKIDIDYTPDVTTKYNVKSIPTVILVENGQEVKRFTGARSFEQVMSFCNGK